MVRILISFILFTLSTQACQVPVFRYALERWQADKYRLQVVHDKPLVKPTAEFLEQLKAEGAAASYSLNLSVEVYDSTKLTEAQQWSIIGLDDIESFPAHILTAPDALEIPEPILTEGTSESSLKSLTHSPVREQIIKQLVSGDSAVFIHLLSGDTEKDAKTRKLLDASLLSAQESIKLPDGVIKPDEVAAAQAKGEIDFDDVLRSTIPLKISFSVVTLDPKDPAEQSFIKILLNGATPEQLPESSIIAPVFGRGRCLGLIPSSKLTEKVILEKCNYLCSACACSVKSENPGFDLILQTNWDEKLANSSVIPDRELGELTGTGDFLNADPASIKDQPLEEVDYNSHHGSNPTKSEHSLNPIILTIIAIMIIGLIPTGFIYYKIRKSKS